MPFYRFFLKNIYKKPQKALETRLIILLAIAIDYLSILAKISSTTFLQKYSIF